MYFFDFADWCILQGIGSNSVNTFLTPVETTWDNFDDEFRSTKNALLKIVNEWYDISNSNSVTYQYDSSVNLSWPSNTDGYELYSGGFVNNGGPTSDDGWSQNPILLPVPFKMDNVASDNLYVGTNGYFMLGNGRGQIETTPTVGPPAILCGNPGDNWLQPNLVNSDGDVQNLWFSTYGDSSGKYNVKILVYGGAYSDNALPTSWIGNFYRDSQYQWFETRAKSNLRGNAGPYNSSSVASGSSTTSQVWRGDLNGQNWVRMGAGSVTSPRTCPQCETYYTQFTATTTSITSFWDDSVTNFANTTQTDFTTYVQNVYHQQCLLKQLLKCVDGDTFPTFDI
jgi:hypothetical protein